MALPPFNSDAVLPLGDYFDEMDGVPVFSGHDSTLSEVQSKLVLGYDDSTTRSRLFQEFWFLHAIATSILDCVTFLVAGEFVTAHDDPQDVMIVLEVPEASLGLIEPKDNWNLRRLFNAEGWSIGKDEGLRIETRLVRTYPPGDLKFDLGLEEQKLARFLCGSPTEGVTQGYVEIVECEGVMEDIAEITEAPTA